MDEARPRLGQRARANLHARLGCAAALYGHPAGHLNHTREQPEGALETSARREPFGLGAVDMIGHSERLAAGDNCGRRHHVNRRRQRGDGEIQRDVNRRAGGYRDRGVCRDEAL